MARRSNYEKGYRSFIYHLAEDAIMAYLERRPHLNGYLEDLARNLEGLDAGTWEGDPEALLDEATAAANELANRVRSSEEGLDGTNYNLLVEAAYDRIGIAH